MNDKVPFDPGIGVLVSDIYSLYNEVNFKLSNLRSIQQKRTFFKLFAQKIEKYINNNISFLTGCLLWAYLISNNYNEEPKEIEGNVFFNSSEYDYLEQVNFLKSVFESFQKDYLYYGGRKFDVPKRWEYILNVYSEFLSLNKGFINLKYTSDLLLPDELKNAVFNFSIDDVIYKAITEKDLNFIPKIEKFTV